MCVGLRVFVVRMGVCVSFVCVCACLRVIASVSWKGMSRKNKSKKVTKI